MSVHVYGIRHHGPGSARSLLRALNELQPDIVLVEGPSDAQRVISAVGQAGLVPPVALLVYCLDEPQMAVFYPFAEYSPEWQALLWAADHGIPARFMDLPQSFQLAAEKAEPGIEATEDTEPAVEEDPIGALARAAGYSDYELWWERQFEQRQDAEGLFEAVLEAMTALRETAKVPEGIEALREAYMRRSIRAAQYDNFERIAVVCGAWHAPALTNLSNTKADKGLFARLPKRKIEATWIPWTSSRLSHRSGYGAGIESPGWYEHIWRYSNGLSVRWATRAAGLLRSEGLDAPSSNVIEAARLSETLAALRDLPAPGLAEVNDGVLTALCNGETTSMKLIHRRLEIGESLGEVPDDVPTVPLRRDLIEQQRKLRLRPVAESKALDLDLRRDIDLTRSHMLHRLLLLGIPWGTPQKVVGKSGTFHELWDLQWRAEFEVDVIEANVWGNTLEIAATARATNAATNASDLPALTEMLHRAMLADLQQAIAILTRRVGEMSAVAADITHLMDALQPLARIARYGDVRNTSGIAIMPIITGLFERVVVGLGNACRGLDDDAASTIVTSMSNAHEAVMILDYSNLLSEWQDTLRKLIHDESAHPLIRGWCCRMLIEQQEMETIELSRTADLALSTSVPLSSAASWIEGFLRGSGLVLLHQDALWQVLDSWLSRLPPKSFIELLPVIRRAFSGFQPPERRAMREKIASLHSVGGQSNGNEVSANNADNLDRERANKVMPVLAQILGVTYDGG